MDEPSPDSSDDASQRDPAFTPLPGNGICARLGDKWTVQVVWHLAAARGRPLRFSSLLQNMAGITQRMLTLTLRNLERDGMLVRHYYPEVPPRVEYELSEMGAGMLPALKSVNTWIRGNLPGIEASRRAYDDDAQ